MSEIVVGLRKARGYVKSKLTRLRTQVLQITGEQGDLEREQAETRLERLEEIYRGFEEIQRRLFEEADEMADEDKEEEEMFEQKYFEVKALLRRFSKAPSGGVVSGSTGTIVQLLKQQATLIEHIERGTRSDASDVAPTPENDTLAAILSRQTEILERVSNATGSAGTDNRVKLPTIKLPRFDGNIEEWKHFSDSFRSIIHSKPHLSNIEKFQYLISSISGDAEKIIESIDLTSENYVTAWELLQQRFDDPRSLKKRHIECLFAMPAVVKESAKALRDLIDYTLRHLRVLKVLDSPTDAWDELIIHMLETKIDVKTLRAWEEEIQSKEVITLTDMLEFLKQKCQTLQRIESRLTARTDKPVKEGGKGPSTTGSKSAKAEVYKKAVLTTSVESADRIKEVKRLRLCLNCLKKDHYVKACRMSHCKECEGKHNTLCHIPQATQFVPASSGDSEAQDKSNSESSANNLSVHHSSNKERGHKVLMATAVIEAVRHNGASIPLRVLLDSASEANFITQSAYNKLGLAYDKVSEIITGLNEIENKVHNSCEVRIKSRHSNFEILAQCLIIPKITKCLPSSDVDSELVRVPNDFKLADPKFFRRGSIDLLIGAEFFYDLIESGKIELGKRQLVLQNTKFGWIVAGSIPPSEVKDHFCKQGALTVMSCSFKNEDNLSENLERFWKLEGYDADKIQELSVDERYCEQHFAQTTTRADDGRFIVRLPLRRNLPIGHNKDLALRRLYQLERKFNGNEVFRERYIKFMSEYLELGHMSVVNEPLNTSENVVYLPHHGVLKESSSSTKLRVVFDASARNNNGAALNDALLIGPVLQDNLIDIILRFRFHKVAITADLQKMYRQVLVHPADRDWQRILWRSHADEPVKEYQLDTVTYGQACASYLAVRCLRQLATEGSERYPLAARALLNDTYVDDIISGTSTVEDAQVLQEQLTLLLAEGGFKAHKWCSNSESALQNVPTDLTESNASLNINTNDIIRTLGIEWNPISDEFLFTAQIITSASTKREILSAISKLFDPLGLVGPVLTTAKIFMQGLWKVNAGWDEPLSETILSVWREFQISLKDIKMLRIPRLVVNSSCKGQVYLHGFCDASENAYGACVYVQLIRSDSSEISCMLLCSKARVAPLKKQSIPRLELCSALVLARLLSNVRRAITKIDGIHAWSDSMVVLHWLNGDSLRWKPFVSHRTTEIIETVPAVHWKHVKGTENPADLISRGVTPAQLRESSLWWHGPGWLCETPHSDCDEGTHPNLNEDELTSIKLETRKETRICNLNLLPSSTRDTMDKLIQDCSTLTRIERSLAYCFRFVSNCRKKGDARMLGRLTLPELMKARQAIIKHSQGTYFQKDLRNLLNNGQLHPSSQLRQLHAFLDECGILRVGGRLQETSWNFDRKHPILLPAKCKVTRLIIEREHRALLHASQQLLLASIRRQYWPLNARNLVRQVCRSCVWCVKNNPKGLIQAMGSLPKERIRPSRPFSVTGVDFAGPIITLVNKGRGRKTNKSYIALFICFATRAIHLEAVSELSTAAFMAALRRFVGRRGSPSKICSDNATNFVGAKRELEELFAFIRTNVQGTVADALHEMNIEWSFIPPYSPHFGGIWEAGVKSCKYHLRRVMGNTLFTFEELTTALVQIEACLNSRPLSPLSSDPSDLQPLTPGHFLIGCPLTSLPETDLSDVNINRLDRWESIQRSVQDFWLRWAAEYVSNLQGRIKWQSMQENLKIDDFVLIREECLPPLKWKTGRVTELHTGRDNLVRVVTVRTLPKKFD